MTGTDTPAVDGLIGYHETPVDAATFATPVRRPDLTGRCGCCHRPLGRDQAPCGHPDHADRHDGQGGVCDRCDRALGHDRLGDAE